ncbi:MAG: ribonuclease E/G, partial [Caldimonas sp.]
LIVVDFIDMEESKNRREVETRLRDALRSDRARVQFSSISKFGLLEMSRQRLRPALSEGSHITCPRCNGTGHIRDTESSALQILRMVQEESMKDNTAAVHVQVPVEVTSFLLNEKRTEITKIELKQRVTVLLVPNKALETPNYRLERLRHDDPRLENLQASYTMIDEPEEEVGITRREKVKPKQEPVIKGIMPETPAPQAAPRPEPRAPQVDRPVAALPVAAPAPAPVSAAAPAGRGFFSWVKSIFAGAEPEPVAAKPLALPAPTTGEPPKRERGERDGRGERGDRGDRGGDRGGRGGRGGRRGERSADRPEGSGDGRGRRGERGGDAVRTDAAEPARGEAREPREARAPRDPREPRAARGERGGERGERGGDRGERGGDRGGQRGEPRQEGRDESRGDDRRGARNDRPAPVSGAANEAALAADGAAAPGFVDTQPNAAGGETADGDRQGGRRRNRRGGRGRDRDDLNGSEIARAAPAANDGEAVAARHDEPESLVDGEAVEPRAEAGDATIEDAGNPSDTRGEGSGSRRRRGGRGRDRGPREAAGDADTSEGTMRDAAPPRAAWQGDDALPQAANDGREAAVEATPMSAV